MKKYALKRLLLGSTHRIDITEIEYKRMHKAQNSLLTCLLIEEAFDILIDNYIEFEITLLHSSLTNSIRFKSDYQEFRSERRLFNRRLMNLFTTSQSYVDQIKHYVSQLFGKESEKYIKFEQTLKQKYNDSFGYRVMDTLRDYVQHRGWAIHSTTYNFKRIDKDNDFKLLFTITPSLIFKYIEKDKKIKPQVLSEIKGRGKDIDIRPLVREYVEALADIHIQLRQVLQDSIKEWEETILNTIERFKNEFQGASPLGLSLIAEENGKVSDSVSIIKELIESRKYLEEKNKNLTNLEKGYVTSEIIEK